MRFSQTRPANNNYCFCSCDAAEPTGSRVEPGCGPNVSAHSRVQENCASVFKRGTSAPQWKVCDLMRRFGTKETQIHQKWEQKHKKIRSRFDEKAVKQISLLEILFFSCFVSFVLPTSTFFPPLTVMSFFFFPLSAALSPALKDKCYYLIMVCV